MDPVDPLVVVRIGPFELSLDPTDRGVEPASPTSDPLGAGGMGEVWAATHTATQLEVAIKVIASEVALSERFRRAFRNEVRAAASLDHPGVVHVLDAGEISAEAAEASRGRLVSGSPYLATERLTGGSLSDWVQTPRVWSEVLEVALGLLSALAHAHARGVIHRDVKPSNVLLDASGRPRLTDFGIAHLADADGPIDDLGTPPYMAPEQVVRARAALGPWTDVYGFGCTLWALLTGEPPFGDLRGEALRRAQLGSDRPPLRPTLAVPSSLERVLHRALATSPNARYARAAELAADLRALGGADRPGVVVGPRSSASLPPAPERTPAWIRTTRELPYVDGVVPMEARAQPVRIPLDATPGAPFPAEAAAGIGVLRGAGTGLFGLRQPPIAGRRDERQALWAAFVDVVQGNGPRALVLSGATGVGKTRLSAWLGETAHAVAGAEVLTAEHGPTDGGLDTLVGSWLGLRPSRKDEDLTDLLAFRLASLPDAAGTTGGGIDRDALIELVAPTGRVRFTEPVERYAAIAAVVARLASERPVVVRLEDVQWGAEALGLAQHLLDAGAAAARVLVVLTVREEVLAGRPIEKPLVRELAAGPRATALSIGPLPRRDRQQLIQSLLPLEPSLVARVGEHTGGNPLFTVELVGELVSSGALESEEGGLRLRPDATPRRDLAEVWAQRLEALLAGAHGSVGTALEVAATLGQHVDAMEWSGALGLREIPVPRRLPERLVDAGLARTEGDPDAGFVFVHAMLRDVLIARAEAADRLAGHHAACAAWLGTRRGPGVALRRGRHLLEAGDADAASEALHTAAAELIAQGQLDEADSALELWDAAMTQAVAPVHDVRWGNGWRLRYELAFERGDFDAADTHAERVLDHARWHGWTALECRALLDRAGVANARGQRELAAQLVGRACELPEASADPVLAAHCRLWEGVIHAARGEHPRARRAFADAHERFVRAGEALDAARAARFDAMAALRSGDPASALTAATAAREAFAAIGHRPGIATADNTLGEASRLAGDLAGAERWYRSARDGMVRLGLARAVIPEVNLATVLVDLGRAGEARRALDQVARSAACRARPQLAAAVQTLRVAAAALERDWSACDLALDEARVAVAAIHPDTDTQTAIRRAASAVRAAGDEARARAVEALAELGGAH